MRGLLSRLHSLPTWVWFVAGTILLWMFYAASIPWCGAWDPWETHYGGVARNILVRSDPLDLWWTPGRSGPDRRYESLFASKHVLPFWLMAASLELFGIGTSRDPAELAFSTMAELALRLPSLLTGIATIAFVAYVTKRCVSGRAAIFAAIALATMPMFALISRQALTDMFLTGPLMLAWGAWALAWFDDDRPLRTRVVAGHIVTWDRAHLGFVILFAIAAVLPLLVLQHHVVSEVTVDRVAKFKRKPDIPNLETLRTIYWHLTGYWIPILLVLIFSFRWRSKRTVWLAIMYIATGLAFMGKGLLGPALVGVVLLVDSWIVGRSARLWRSHLLLGTLLVVVVAAPWHHAMGLYRGERWIRELIFENNLARFSSGEQEQAVGTAAFYLRTLGISAFPWVALLPWVAVRAPTWLRAGRTGDEPSDTSPTKPAELARFSVVATALGFLTITYSVTKYNHYLLPCLPPLAMILGIALSRADKPATGSTTLGERLACVGGIAIAALVIRELLDTPAWLAHLTTVYYDGVWREGAPATDVVVWLAVPGGVGLLLWTSRIRDLARAIFVAGAVIFAAYVLQAYLPAASATWSQRDLFRYYYTHREPDDQLASWWLHHRGETYFSKGDLWISVSPRQDVLNELVTETHAEGHAVWIVTTQSGKKRLRRGLPRDVRDRLDVAFETPHHALLRLPAR